MSAYFESLNRRTSTPPAVTAPSLAPVAAPDPAPVAKPGLAARSQRRLTPGAIPPAYARLRERLMLAARGKAYKALVFAGCDGGEGCTDVVREFAESLASAGLNVLLVDADLRTAGLTTSLAARGVDLAELVRRKEAPGGDAWGRGRLAIVPGSGAVADKESFLRSAELAAWLDTQRAGFDYVLLDSAPILRHADATLAGLFCDGVVLVAKAGATRGQQLSRARQQIERAGGTVLGVVLNQVRNPVPAFLQRYISTTE